MQLSEERWNALDFAFIIENQEICQLLIDNGPPLKLNHIPSMPPLIVAVRAGHLAKVEEILRNSDTDINCRAPQNFCTGLHLAAEHGNKEICQVLLNNGNSVNAVNIQGMTTLHIATILGHTEVMNLILSREETNVNAVNKDKQTPLHYACKLKDVESTKLLLAHDANVATSSHPSTVLHIAVISKDIVIVRLIVEALLKKGTVQFRESFDAKDDHDKTALDYSESEEDICKELCFALERSLQ